MHVKPEKPVSVGNQIGSDVIVQTEWLQSPHPEVHAVRPSFPETAAYYECVVGYIVHCVRVYS
jgi:hypothetical protein